MASTQFIGLPMPVFTAFGWAEEAAAIKFALDQLEAFVSELHRNLPPALRTLFPHFGVDSTNKYAYLATDEDPEEGIYFTFTARPMSFLIALSVTNRRQLVQIFRVNEDDLPGWYAALVGLPETWTMRIQHMQAEEDPPTHYQDVYNDEVSKLDLEKTREITDRASYLNGEDKWLAVLHFNRKLNSELVATMGTDSARVIAEEFNAVAPLLNWLAFKTKRARATTRKPARAAAVRKSTSPQPEVDMRDVEDKFVFQVELQPLHVRKGFINLTPAHWPFFAKSARTEIQPVTVLFDGHRDHNSSVWRLVPDDLARVVLSGPVKLWLQDNFDANDMIEVYAVKLGPENYEVTLRAPAAD